MVDNVVKSKIYRIYVLVLLQKEKLYPNIKMV